MFASAKTIGALAITITGAFCGLSASESAQVLPTPKRHASGPTDMCAAVASLGHKDEQVRMMQSAIGCTAGRSQR